MAGSAELGAPIWQRELYLRFGHIRVQAPQRNCNGWCLDTRTPTVDIAHVVSLVATVCCTM